MKSKILIAGALVVIALAIALPLRNALANGSLQPFGTSQSQVKLQQAGAAATPPADCPTDTPDQPETKSANDTDHVEQQCGDQTGTEQDKGTPEANEKGKLGKGANEQGETKDANDQGGTEGQDGQPNSGVQIQSQ